MRELGIVRARNRSEVFAALTAHPQARLIAGGTNLVDLMKEGVETPDVVVDINPMNELRRIEIGADGGMVFGSLVSNSETAWHPDVRMRFPVISEAILAGATRQRVERARRLIEIGRPLAETAAAVGFSDQSHLARHHKGAFGRRRDKRVENSSDPGHT
jgi:xanthine dehydrogenase YagS FAD-binding subunit